MKKTIIWALIIVAIIAITLIMISENKKNSVNENIYKNSQVNSLNSTKTDNTSNQVKEFSMTSFVDMSGGSPKPQFSLKEIVVNKGDKVRIKITNTAGVHDFKIDEFDVYTNTELNKEAIVEFTADKAGSFVYYCTKPGHRQLGHWGTLKVI